MSARFRFAAPRTVLPRFLREFACSCASRWWWGFYLPLTNPSQTQVRVLFQLHQRVCGVLAACVTWTACSALPETKDAGHAAPRFEPVATIDTVAAESGCPKCRVDVRHLVALGDEDQGQLDQVNAAARDSRGRYWVVTQQRMYELLLFDPEGKFVRAVGRQGSGPGEYQGVTAVALGAGDTLNVFDHVLRRWTVVAPTAEVVSTWSLPVSVAWDAVAVGRGMVALNVNPEPRPPSAPLVLVDSSGIRKAFGGDAGIVRGQDRPYLAWRKLSPSRDGGLWSIPVTEFRLEEWTFAGKKLREMVRKAPPFERWPTDDQESAPANMPRPSVVALRQDGDGLLWVLLRVPDPQWDEKVAHVGTPEGRARVPIDPSKVYRTILEVIDPQSRSLIVSQHLEVDLRGFVDAGIGYGFSEEPRPQMHVWSLRLVRP